MSSSISSSGAAAILPLALVEKCIGARMWVIMRGNTEFAGTLKGFDDYVNIVLDEVTEFTYDSEGNRSSTQLEGSILLNGNAVTFLVPGAEPN